MKTVIDIRQNCPSRKWSIELCKFVFFDIETTGLRPDRRGKITEIAILNRSSRQFIWKSNERTETDSFQNILPKVLTLLNNGVVIGHNLQFDFWFISHEADKLGIEGPSIRFIDTLSLSRKALPDRSSYKLSKLLKYFDINIIGDLHTATTDAEATRALFWKLVEKGGIATVGEAGMKKLNWSSF